jgi:hypothetical protein
MLASNVSALVRTPPKIAEDLFDFVRTLNRKKPDATCLQAKTGLEADGKTVWHVGLNNRPQIVCGPVQPEVLGGAESSVELEPGYEIFTANTNDLLFAWSASRRLTPKV